MLRSIAGDKNDLVESNCHGSKNGIQTLGNQPVHA